MHRPLNICQLMGEFVIKPPVKNILEQVLLHQPEHIILYAWCLCIYVCVQVQKFTGFFSHSKISRCYGKIGHASIKYVAEGCRVYVR